MAAQYVWTSASKNDDDGALLFLNRSLSSIEPGKILVWFDPQIEHTDEYYQHSIAELQFIFTRIMLFSDATKCVDYLNKSTDHQICVFLSHSINEEFVNRIHGLWQVYSIYILQDKTTDSEILTENWTKLKRVSSQLDSLCLTLKKDSRLCDRNLLPIDIIALSNDIKSSLIYFSTLKEFLNTIEHDQEAKNEFLQLYKTVSYRNKSQLEILDRWERDYDLHQSIWWYKNDTMIFSMVNQALRTFDSDMIIKMRFILGDIHRQIEQMQKLQSYDLTKMTIYRGQRISNTQFENLKNNRGGLICFNSFLSASIDRETEVRFCSMSPQNVGMNMIIFHMEIDTSRTTTPFASLNNTDFPDFEDEILFSLNSVFRVGEVLKIEELLWQVHLTSIDQNDELLKYFTSDSQIVIPRSPTRNGPFHSTEGIDKYNEEDWLFFRSTGFSEVIRPFNRDLSDRFLALKMEDDTDGLLYYGRLLDLQLPLLFSNIPQLHCTDPTTDIPVEVKIIDQKLLLLIEKILEILLNTLTRDQPGLIRTYNKLGSIFQRVRCFHQALHAYHQALDLQQQIFTGNQSERARIYNNIGFTHESIKDYAAALNYYGWASEILEADSTSTTNVDLVRSYNGIAFIHDRRGDPGSAAHYYRKILGSQHGGHFFDLIASVTRGKISSCEGHYQKALINFHEALLVGQFYWSDNHPYLQTLREYIHCLARHIETPSVKSLMAGKFSESLFNKGDLTSQRGMKVHEIMKSMSLKSKNASQLKHDDRKKACIVCLNITNSSLLLTECTTYFNDAFQFIANVLSKTNQRQYLIVSDTIAELVVPLIHKHFSIEKIFVDASSVQPSSENWIQPYSKVVEVQNDLAKLCDQVLREIDAWSQRPLHWNRSDSLVSMTNYQKFDKYPMTAYQISAETFYDMFQIICCHRTSFSLMNYNLEILKEYESIDVVTKYAASPEKWHIFLIIGDNRMSSDLEEIINSNNIAAIYYYNTDEIILPENRCKVAGYFEDFQELQRQLSNDFHLQRQQKLHSPQVLLAPTCEAIIEKSISPIDHNHIQFLIFQLFIDILPQIPPLIFTSKEISDECNISVVDSKKDQEAFLTRITNGTINIDEDGPNILKIVSQVLRYDKLHNWLMFTKSLNIINQRASQSDDVSLPFTVYCTHMMIEDQLKILQLNSHSLISITNILFATPSLETTSAITRQLTDCGLIACQFEIELRESSTAINIDHERVMFRFGSVFQLKSIDKGPDNVFHVKMICTDFNIQSMIEQIEIDIETPLTWLTFGNYLTELGRFNEAESYYKILLGKLPENHPDLPAIYNNIGLAYTIRGAEEEALKHYNLAEKYINKIETSKTSTMEHKKNLKSCGLTINNLPSLNPNIDRSLVYEQMALIHFSTNHSKLALESYEKALESCADQRRCRIYQKQISLLKATLVSK